MPATKTDEKQEGERERERYRDTERERDTSPNQTGNPDRTGLLLVRSGLLISICPECIGFVLGIWAPSYAQAALHPHMAPQKLL